VTLALGVVLVSTAACGPIEPAGDAGAPSAVVESESVEIISTPPTREIRPGSQSGDPVTLDFSLEGDPSTLDPALVTDQASLDSSANLFIGLTRYDPVTSAVIPYLAIGWDISPDGLVYTFYLRDDVQWVRYRPETKAVETQRPVTAFDVEFGVKRSLDSKTESRYAYALYIIKNAALVHAGIEGMTLDDIGVKALDDFTIQFTLEEPAAYFPSIAAMWVAKPQPSEPVEAHQEKWTEPGAIWTSGPYMLTHWVPGESLRFERNPFWIHASQVQIEIVNAQVVIDRSTGLALFQDNELDIATVPIADLQQVRDDPFLSQLLARRPLPCTYYYGFTTTKAPFDDVRVRTAFSAAINRRGLIETTLENSGQVQATSFAPPGTFGAPPPGTVGLGYDPELATSSLQEYLDETGLEDAAAFDAKYDIVLGINTGELHERIAAAIQEMWMEILGVSVRIEDQEWGEHLESTQSTAPINDAVHIFRMGWCADYPDENNWIRQVFHYQEGPNRSRRQCADPNCAVLIGPAAFDRLVLQAAAESDPTARTEAYALAEDILAREKVAAAFIFHHGDFTVTKSWLQRDFPLMGGANWYDWRIDWAIKSANR
jgi:oligopeptide transport system substrate-binding protein